MHKRNNQTDKARTDTMIWGYFSRLVLFVAEDKTKIIMSYV